MVNQDDLPELAAVFKAAIAAHIAPLQAQIAALKARLDDRPVSCDGKDADPVDYARIDQTIEAGIQKAVTALPKPKDGRDGDNGRSVEPAELLPLIERLVTEKVEKGIAAIIDAEALFVRLKAELPALIPPPVHGKDALPVDSEALFVRLKGELPAMIPPPLKGDPGEAASIDLGQLQILVDASVSATVTKELRAAVAALPQPKDGVDAPPVDESKIIAAVMKSIEAEASSFTRAAAIDAAIDAAVMRNMKFWLDNLPKPRDGVDGASVDPETVRLMVENAVKALPTPKDGANGKDGFSLEDFSTELLADGRTLRLKFASGENSAHHDVRLGVPLYRGIFVRGGTYERDDMVTFHNEVWIGIVEKPTETPGISKHWRLAVRKGRDSKPVRIVEE